MIEAGLSSSTALVILEQQTDDDVLAARIDDIRARRRGRARSSPRRWRASEVFSPPVHRDGRGRRGRRRPRRRPRPRRDPDREGAADQAPRQGRDDLPVRRAHVRDPRPDRDADVPRPDLRQDLRLSSAATCRSSPSMSSRVERPARVLVHHLPGRRRRRLRVLPLEGDRATAGRSRDRSSSACRCRSAMSCSRSSMARFSRTLSTLSQPASTSCARSRSPAQTAGNWVVENGDARARARPARAHRSLSR